MKRVGITGGIGSGKSYVCHVLEKMGYPVFYSDSVSKHLTENHPDIRKGLIELVGNQVFEGGQLNRSFLAEKIFNDESIRQAVNALIHPIVRKAFSEWANSQTAAIVFNEAAILIETGAYKTLDFTVLVTAETEVRIQRTMKRDGVTREQVLARMSKQWSDEEKTKHADFIVFNDERPLLNQLETLIDQISE